MRRSRAGWNADANADADADANRCYDLLTPLSSIPFCISPTTFAQLRATPGHSHRTLAASTPSPSSSFSSSSAAASHQKSLRDGFSATASPQQPRQPRQQQQRQQKRQQHRQQHRIENNDDECVRLRAQKATLEAEIARLRRRGAMFLILFLVVVILHASQMQTAPTTTATVMTATWLPLAAVAGACAVLDRLAYSAGPSLEVRGHDRLLAERKGQAKSSTANDDDSDDNDDNDDNEQFEPVGGHREGLFIQESGLRYFGGALDMY